MTGVTAIEAALSRQSAFGRATPDCARRHGVEALLAHASGRTDVVAAYEAVAAVRTRELRRVLDAFAAAGLQAVVIKGAHLGHVLYASSALRPHGDVDLVVAADEIDAVPGVVKPLGYERLPHVRGRVILGQHHFRRTDHLGVPHALDVHWRIAAPLVFRDVLTAGVLRTRAVPIAPLGPHGCGPSLSDALAIACVHLAAHHRRDALLLWLHEIAMLAAELDERGREVFLRYAVEARITVVCGWALQRASECFEDAAVTRLRDELRQNQDRFEPSAELLTAAGPLHELLVDLRSAGWRERAMLLVEHLWPDAEYMRGTSGTWLPFAYARRALRGARTWLNASSTPRTAESGAPPVDSPEASSSPARAKTSPSGASTVPVAAPRRPAGAP